MTHMHIRPRHSVNYFLYILICLYFAKSTKSSYTGISESLYIYIYIYIYIYTHIHVLICEPNTMVYLIG
jgi:hypothetical protein